VASLPVYPIRPAPIPDSDRLPPQNLEAERSVLGSILLDNKVIAEVRKILYVPHLYRDAHQIIYQAMLDLDDLGSPIDIISVTAQLELRDQLDDLVDDDCLESIVSSVPHAANAMYYAELVREKAASRAVIEHATQLMRNAYSNCFTADELITQFEKKADILHYAHLDGREEEEPGFSPLPNRMGRAAFRGLLGQIVDTIAPQTEACPEAILGQFIVGLGNLIGPAPHWRHDRTKHRCNLFLCLVGPTGQGRKGTSWDIAEWLLGRCDPEWQKRSVVMGLSSGEGLVAHASRESVPLMIIETELSRTLGSIGRDTNILSAILRQAWEGPRLRILNKNNPIDVQNSYISMAAHTTLSDLKTKLQQNDVDNGLVNRYAFMNVYRANLLSEGGDSEAVETALGPLITSLIERVEFARKADPDRPMRKTPAARALWKELYEGPYAEKATGDFGKVKERGAPMTLRMAVIYALLDLKREIDVPHIEAARAFWLYCEATAASIFGNTAVSLEGARVMKALREDANDRGMSRTEINRKAFSGHKTPEAVDAILVELNHAGMIASHLVNKGGKSCIIWKRV
jgi:hypothetical protein